MASAILLQLYAIFHFIMGLGVQRIIARDTVSSRLWSSKRHSSAASIVLLVLVAWLIIETKSSNIVSTSHRGHPEMMVRASLGVSWGQHVHCAQPPDPTRGYTNSWQNETWWKFNKLQPEDIMSCIPKTWTSKFLNIPSLKPFCKASEYRGWTTVCLGNKKSRQKPWGKRRSDEGKEQGPQALAYLLMDEQVVSLRATHQTPRCVSS